MYLHSGIATVLQYALLPDTLNFILEREKESFQKRTLYKKLFKYNIPLFCSLDQVTFVTEFTRKIRGLRKKTAIEPLGSVTPHIELFSRSKTFFAVNRTRDL
jgi:hypothetical protein